MDNIDFNDLLVRQGIDAVREQIAPAITAAANVQVLQPAPPSAQAAEPPPASLNGQLKGDLDRFALIVDVGKMTNKVYDLDSKLEMTKTQFRNKVGKKRCDDWFAHENKTIDRAEVDAERQQYQDKTIISMLERYYYIDTTEEAWDVVKRQRCKLTAVKHKNPNNYDTWYKSQSRLDIEPENIWFDPTGDRRPKIAGDLYANSYRGLPIDPADVMTHEQAAAAAQPILQLLAHLCNHDTHDINWVLNWLAIPLQQPGAKLDTALIFHGRTQGAGKSLFFGGVMGAIYGDYSLVLGQSQLEGQYNDWIDGKLWAIFEEIFVGNDRYQNSNMVKQLVTGTEIYINKKFMSGWKQENHVNCVFLSNDMMPLAIEDDDRRMFVVRPKTKCPSELSHAVGQAIKDPTKNMLRAFLQFLLTKDIGDQTDHDAAPMTQAKADLITVSAASWVRFIWEWSAGALVIPFDTCLATDLYKVYKRWCENNGDRAANLNKLTGHIRQLDNFTTQRSHYKDKKDAGKRKQGTFVVLGDLPTTSIENYFTAKYNAYHDKLSDMTDAFSPIQTSQHTFHKS